MAATVAPEKTSFVGDLGLSARELEVLRLVASGATNAQAGEQLGISPLTVKKHLERMYAATGARNRSELIARAYDSAGTPWKTQPRPRHNLPSALTRFLGRERELSEVASLLATSRLVTLGGPGGIGKTRLALEAAALVLDRFADGACLVELGSLSDPRMVPQAVSSALGLPETARSRVAALTAALRPRRVLIVLDNCEHLSSACAELLGPLLRECADVRVLATSRETLGVPGEVFWPVPGLSLPEGSERPTRAVLRAVEQSEAAQLFAERARLRVPRFALSSDNAANVARICSRLDGLPLAIELAAARMNVLSVQEIAARLDDRSGDLRTDDPGVLPRHRTLRGAIEWSHQLLGRAEATLFARLAVFAGGCTLEAAGEVCAGGDIEEGEVLEILARLVDRSFLIADTRRAETRYRILETLHEYGRERLERSGETEPLRARLAEHAEPQLRGAQQLAWYERLDTDHDNFRAALAWAVEHDAETALRIAGALWRFWFHRGYGAEGLRWLEQALALPGPVSAVARGKALNGAGNLADFAGDPPRSERLHRENLELQRQQATPELFLLTAALSNLGDRLRERGATAEARPLYVECLALRPKEDQWGRGLNMSQLGHIAMEEGDLDEAAARYGDALRLLRRSGDRDRTAWCLGFLARLERTRGRYWRAATHMRRSLVTFRAFGDRIGMTQALEARCLIAMATGDLARAARLLGASTAARGELHAPKAVWEKLDGPLLEPLRSAIAAGRFADEWNAGRATRLEDAVDAEIG
jgi:predicted ATPase/DNA-binding CsgD family transcriptional regulator